MSTSEIFLIAMVIIFTVPYLIWRLGKTEYYAPLVVVQIIAGILLGPGILGAIYPDYYQFVFTQPVTQSLNGIALWAVMVFVWIAGIELDIGAVWQHRRETTITASAPISATSEASRKVLNRTSTPNRYTSSSSQVTISTRLCRVGAFAAVRSEPPK